MKTTEVGPGGDGQGKFLCLTICGYRKKGMHESDYRHHMTQVSAPMTKDLMVKYGIVRWVQIHNQAATKAMMSQLYDPQMANLADFDCFSQVTFKRLEDYKRFKQDPVYKQRLTGDHENFADTKRSSMTIGWVEQFIDGGVVVDGIPDPAKSTTGTQLMAAVTGAFLSGAMMALSLIGIPVFLDTTPTTSLMYLQWARMYHYGHYVLPALSVMTFVLYMYIAQARASAQRSWTPWILAGLTTIAMVPFTWLIMVPTNNTLFELEAATRAGLPDNTTLADAQALVARWSYLHLARSVFPLAGAASGSWATFKMLLY